MMEIHPHLTMTLKRKFLSMLIKKSGKSTSPLRVGCFYKMPKHHDKMMKRKPKIEDLIDKVFNKLKKKK